MSQNAHSDVSGKIVPAAARYFDYAAAVALRNLAAEYGTAMPRYLLPPEVAVLLSYEPDQKKHLLIETFWNTGGRLNEVLPLTPEDFVLDGPDGRPVHSPFVVLHTLKQRRRALVPGGAGRPARKRGEPAPRRAAHRSGLRAAPAGISGHRAAEKGRTPLGREQPGHGAQLDTPGGDRRRA